MTFGEILVVLIVALLVTKPSDIPVIIKYIRGIVSYLRKMQSEILRYLDEDDDLEEINKYLSKISDLGFKYEGDYKISSIKSYYHDIIKSKMKENS
jgi:Sec-independent protein translocase protein TatA